MSNTRSTGRLKSIIAYSISQAYAFGIVTISTLVLTREGKNLGSLTFPIKIIIFHLVKSLPHPNPKEKFRFRYLFNCTLCRIYSIPQSRIIKTIPSAHNKSWHKTAWRTKWYCSYLLPLFIYFYFLFYFSRFVNQQRTFMHIHIEFNIERIYIFWCVCKCFLCAEK